MEAKRALREIKTMKKLIVAIANKLEIPYSDEDGASEQDSAIEAEHEGKKKGRKRYGSKLVDMRLRRLGLSGASSRSTATEISSQQFITQELGACLKAITRCSVDDN
jgi:hypothetical protein